VTSMQEAEDCMARLTAGFSATDEREVSIA